MKRILLVLLLISNYGISQVIKNNNLFQEPSTHEKCGFTQRHEHLMQTDPSYVQKRAEMEALYQQMLNSPMLDKTTYTIPVVVHVIHTGQAVGTGINISDAQIQSAITNLNAAYSNTNTAFTTYTGVNTGVQFCLAQRDASNNPTTGIVRVNGSGVTQYSTKGVCDAAGGTGTDNEQAVKALSKWDNTKYYNIWVVNEINDNGGGAGTQGYAYFPGAGAAVDGAIMLYNAFGYDPDASLGYNLKSYTNRNVTAVHELGHALNLYHTFQGDGTGSTCPSDAVCGTSGDCVADTPKHKRSTSGCIADGTANACQAGTTAGDYQHNFMDYSSDVCQTRFTSGQVTRIVAAMTGGRASLNASSGCNPVYVRDAGIYAIITPNSSTCGTSFTPEVTVKNYGSGSLTSFTISYNIDGGTAQTTNWTGTLTSGSTVDVTLSSMTTTSGAHTFNATTTVPNGLADQYTTNDAQSYGFTVNGNPPTTSSCSPTTTNTGNYQTGIHRVQFNTLDHAHDDTNNDGLQDFTCLYNTTVSVNTAYTLTITGDVNSSEYCLVFIDYNDNGIYESSEIVLNHNTGGTASISHSTSVTIPLYPDVTGKLIRMRCMTDFNMMAGDGCTDVDYGEIEDYSIFITTPACTAPTMSSQPSDLLGCTPTSGTFTVAATGINKSYQWMVDNGSGYVNVTNTGIYTGATTATLTLTGASAAYYGYSYKCYISNACGNVTSNAATLYALASPTASCSPSTTNTGNFQTGIIRFVFNTIDKSHNNLNNDGTQNFVCTNNTTVTAGSTYAFTIYGYASGGAGNNEYARIYIDYNDNGTYEAGELVFNNNTTKQASHTGNITIPTSGLVTGKLLRMRVMTNFSAIADGCSNLSYGEVEDYGILVPCLPPTVTGTTPGYLINNTGSVVLGATPSAGTIHWYSASSGGASLGSGTTYNTPTISSTTTYYAEAYNAGCISATRTAVAATIYATKLDPAACDITMTDYSVPITAVAVPGATSYRFKIQNNYFGYLRYIVTTTPVLPKTWVSDLHYNRTYNISVQCVKDGNWSWLGDVCQVTTPNHWVRLENESCNIALDMINQPVTCKPIGIATNYKYLVENTGLGYSQVFIKGSSDTQFKISALTGILYGTTYSVKVSYLYNGVWSPWGADCDLTTPAEPKLVPGDCGTTVSSMNQDISAIVNASATSYRFLVENVGLGFSKTVSTGSAVNTFKLSSINGIAINTTYTVKVAYYINGIWSLYGSACNVTSAASAMVYHGNGIIDEANGGANVLEEIYVDAYPNPNDGVFTVSSSHAGEFMITNELGQAMQKVVLSKENNYRIEVKDLKNGVYFISGTINNERIIRKVMVMK